MDAFHRNACRVGNYRDRRHGRFRRGRVVLHELLPLKSPIVGERRSLVGVRRLGVLDGSVVDGGLKRVVGMLVVRTLVECLRCRWRGVVPDRRMKEVVQ